MKVIWHFVCLVGLITVETINAAGCFNNCTEPEESPIPIWLPSQGFPESYRGYMVKSVNTVGGCSTMTVTCYGKDTVAIAGNLANFGPQEYAFEVASTPGDQISTTVEFPCTEWGYGAYDANTVLSPYEISCESWEELPAMSTTSAPSTSTTTPSTSTTTPSTSTTTPSTSTTPTTSSTTTSLTPDPTKCLAPQGYEYLGYMTDQECHHFCISTFWTAVFGNCVDEGGRRICRCYISTTTPPTISTTPSTSTTKISTTPTVTTPTSSTTSTSTPSTSTTTPSTSGCFNNCTEPGESPTPISDPANYPGYMVKTVSTVGGCAQMTITCYGQDAAIIAANTVNGPIIYAFEFAPVPHDRVSVTIVVDCTEWGWGASDPTMQLSSNEFACESFEYLPTTTTTTTTSSTSSTTTGPSRFCPTNIKDCTTCTKNDVCLTESYTFPWLTSIPVNFALLPPNANGCAKARLTCTSPAYSVPLMQVNDYIGTNMPVDNTITFDIQCNSNGEWVAVQDTNVTIHSAECYYEE